MKSIWGRFWTGVVVAAFVALAIPFAAGGVGGRPQTSTATTEQAKKPATKSKTTASGKTTTANSSKSTRGKSVPGKKKAAATASRRPTAQTIRLTSAVK